MSTKYFLIYDEPWWRSSHNHSGQVVATTMPLGLKDDLFSACEEHSPYSTVVGDGGPGVLMCWIEGLCNLNFDRLDDDAKRAHVLSLFAGALRNDSRLYSPKHIVAHDWKRQPYAQGAYTSYFPPGVQSQLFFDDYENSEKRPGLFFAGSDYQLGYGNGYIEGAVRSGQEAAEAILARRAE